jgi:thymidine kinase
MSITLIIGPMFSGKSSELFRRMRRAGHAGQTCTLFKYAKDMRYDDDVRMACSHDGMKMFAIAIDSVVDIPLPEVDVIGIDEGQFIVGLSGWAQKAADAGKHVIIAALDSTFEMKKWKITNELIPISEEIIKLRAVCFNCKNDASFSKRIDTTNSAQEVIGGSDKYVASCRKCFNIECNKLIN